MKRFISLILVFMLTFMVSNPVISAPELGGSSRSSSSPQLIPYDPHKHNIQVRPFPTPSSGIKIMPRSLTVTQGEQGRFYIKSTRRVGKFNYQWSLGRQQGEGSDFRVATHRLKPGRYTVNLDVTLKNTFRAVSVPTKDRATLIVKPREIKLVTVPDVIGDKVRVAENKIKNSSLTVGGKSIVPVSNGKDGVVLRQDPKAGGQVTIRKRVNLWVSELRPLPSVPPINPERVIVFKGEIAKFTVSPSNSDLNLFWKGAGKTARGNTFRIPTINLEIKEYPISLRATDRYNRSVTRSAILEVKQLLVRVPKLIGEREWDAKRMLKLPKYTGLHLGQVRYEDRTKGAHKIVLSQEPKAQSLVKFGTRINLLVLNLKIPPFSLQITPKIVRVRQCETAHFKAQTKAKKVKFKWDGANHASSRNSLLIKTDKLRPGTYPVTLSGTDSHNQTARDTAKLIVLESQVTVPDLKGMTRERAISVLQQYASKPCQQLNIGNITKVPVESGRNNIVIKQTPAPGVTVRKWTAVNLDVGEFKIVPLKVNINEQKVSVYKGEKATFEAITDPENLSLTWNGAGVSGHEKLFKIDTEKLQTKAYTIELIGTDNNKRSEKATAILEIKQPLPERIVVPVLTEKPLDEALEKLKNIKELSKGEIVFRQVLQGKDNHVLSQIPSANSEVDVGTDVNLVVSKLTPLSVEIKPGTFTIKQGQTAEFDAVTETARKTNDLAFHWEWLDKTYTGKSVQINSRNMDPGTYEIKLITTDKGFRLASDTAKLIVLEPLELILKTEKVYSSLGSVSNFYLSNSQQVAGLEYRLYFDDNSHSEWFNDNVTKHRFTHAGQYKVYAKARKDGKTYTSNAVNIWILPEWIAIVLAGLGTAAIGTGVVRVSKVSRTRSDFSKNASRVTVNYQIDSGSQKLTSIRFPDSDIKLDFKFYYGLPGKLENQPLNQEKQGGEKHNE